MTKEEKQITDAFMKDDEDGNILRPYINFQLPNYID